MKRKGDILGRGPVHDDRCLHHFTVFAFNSFSLIHSVLPTLLALTDKEIFQHGSFIKRGA